MEAPGKNSNGRKNIIKNKHYAATDNGRETKENSQCKRRASKKKNKKKRERESEEVCNKKSQVKIALAQRRQELWTKDRGSFCRSILGA